MVVLISAYQFNHWNENHYWLLWTFSFIAKLLFSCVWVNTITLPQVSVSCSDGHILSDPSPIQCNSSGLWNATLPSCSFPDCPDVSGNGITMWVTFLYLGSAILWFFELSATINLQKVGKISLLIYYFWGLPQNQRYFPCLIWHSPQHGHQRWRHSNPRVWIVWKSAGKQAQCVRFRGPMGPAHRDLRDCILHNTGQFTGISVHPTALQFLLVYFRAEFWHKRVIILAAVLSTAPGGSKSYLTTVKSALANIVI